MVEPPTANIKPLGPAVNKPQPVRMSFINNNYIILYKFYIYKL